MPRSKQSKTEAMKRLRARMKENPAAHDAYKKSERERYVAICVVTYNVITKCGFLCLPSTIP